MTRGKKGLLFLLIPPFVNILLSKLPGAWLSSDVSQFILDTVTLSFAPIGIFYIATRKRHWTRLRSHKAYEGLSDEQLQYLDDFSWGAYLGNIIWCFLQGLFRWSWQYLIPIWNLYIIYKIAIDGRKLAWEHMAHGNFNRFQRFETRFELILALLYSFSALLAWIA